MVKEDIHNLKGVLDRNSEKYILQLFEDDQDDVRRFMDDLLVQVSQQDEWLNTSIVGSLLKGG